MSELRPHTHDIAVRYAREVLEMEPITEEDHQARAVARALLMVNAAVGDTPGFSQLQQLDVWRYQEATEIVMAARRRKYERAKEASDE